MSGRDFVVLDSGPFSLFCHERNDTTTHKLATYIETRVALGATVAVPLMVVSETARGSRSAKVRNVINSGRVVILPMDTAAALAIADLLHRHDVGSEYVVDASVLVAAAQLDGNVTIVTGDVADLSRLTQHDNRIKIRDVNTLDRRTPGS